MANPKVKANRKWRQVESDSATLIEIGGEGANSDPAPMQDLESTPVAASILDPSHTKELKRSRRLETQRGIA